MLAAEWQQPRAAAPGAEGGACELPEDVWRYVWQCSPSCMFEADCAAGFPFGPIALDEGTKDSVWVLNLPKTPPHSLPILQFMPGDFGEGVRLEYVTFQIDDMLVTLNGNSLWYDLSEFENQSNRIRILEFEPKVSLIMVVKWLKKVSVESIIESVMTKMEGPPVVQSGEDRISGICPLTNKIIVIPVRGVNCKHRGCFDLSGFLCYAGKNNCWMCPVCKKDVRADDLRYDPSYFKIVSCNQR